MRTGPLKKILGIFPIEIDGHELARYVLECGHTSGMAYDMYGEYYPVRRRCPKCRDDKPADVNVQDYIERPDVMRLRKMDRRRINERWGTNYPE